MSSDAPQLVLMIALMIAILGGLVAAAVLLVCGYDWFGRRSLQRLYDGLQIHEVPQSGDVVLTYHTYHGLLIWFTETTHRVTLPAVDARTLLGRLLRFNLTYGWFTYGALFVPPLAVLNYFAQRRSIAAQESANALRAQFDPPAAVLSRFGQEQTKAQPEPAHANAVAAPADQIAEAPTPLQDAEGDPDALPETASIRKASPRSLFHSVIGWTCVVLCVPFVITAVVGLAIGRFDQAGGGALVAAVLGWTARDFLSKHH